MRSSLFALGLALSAGASIASAEIVDRIVAIIDREVVTLSEAEQSREIAGARTGEAPPLAAIVERLIESRLVEREVERFTDVEVPSESIDAALREVRAGFPSESSFLAMLERSGLSEAELRGSLRRQLRTAQYLEQRFRPLTFVSEDQIEAYYRDELAPTIAGGNRVPALAEVEGAIRRILEERAFNHRVEEWIALLKDRARIRRYVW
jgi:peptidyl-prolyl cis-trans isomerase SurA